MNKILKEVMMASAIKTLGQLIRELREQRGLTQEELATKIGISRPTLGAIEKNRNDIGVSELKKLSETLNVSVESLLNPEKQPKIVLNESRKAKKKEPTIRINVPQKNLNKFKEVLLYILDRVGSKPNIGETVIYKLLYFVDFNFYEKYEEQLIGATYIKNKFGPTPIEFIKIVKRMIENNEIMKVKSKYFKYPQTKYLPLRKADLSVLNANEIQVIDDVLKKLSDMSASEISKYSHNDVPWLTTKEEKAIEYESVFYRTIPYSVRDYSEDISRDRNST
jgi:transcriptional regulator with XRE-family HTH domain